MNTTRKEDISKWPSRLDTLIGQVDQCCVNRVVVIESTTSTMDAVDEFAKQQCGVLVVASQQTSGRGQFGRAWVDADRSTLPCTFAVDAHGIEPTMLSALVACAVHETIKSFVPSSSLLLIKWPNDLIIRDHTYPDQGQPKQLDRKIAGVLIEQRSRCTHIGIGINCLQDKSDWVPEIADHAVSLSQLGAQVSRLDLACNLIEHLSHWLAANDRSAVREYYDAHNAMVGTHRSFRYDNTVYSGIVEHLDPLDCLVVQSGDTQHTLPIAQTRHLNQVARASGAWRQG